MVKSKKVCGFLGGILKNCFYWGLGAPHFGSFRGLMVVT